MTEELFPRSLEMNGAAFPLAYRFEPGHPMDGVTVNVPLALLNQLDMTAIDWLVPGMVREKVGWTMKALPKRIRTQLVPVPEHTTKFLEQVQPGKTIRAAVLEYASRVGGERLDDSIWSKEEAPAHLLMNIRVVDDAKRELAMGRDLGELRKRLGEAASLTLAKSKPGMEREGITSWDFGELPEQVTFRRGNQTLTGYPALVDEDTSVAIRLLDTKDKAAEAHRGGVKRVMAIDMKEQVRNDRAHAAVLQCAGAPLQRGDPRRQAQVRPDGGDHRPRVHRRGRGAAHGQRLRGAEEAREGAAPRRHRRRIPLRQRDRGGEPKQFQQAVAQARPSLGRIAQEVRSMRDRLVYPGFLARTPWERLEHIPRYLKGYALRMQKYRANAERDQKTRRATS